MAVKLAVIYYSSTGANFKMASHAAETARQAGAEVRLVRVKETAPPEAIRQNPAWQAHHDATQDVPLASLDDIVWADAVIFSTPTRFGNVTSQMQAFLDTAGGIWFRGETMNKVVSVMSSASNTHGGQEATVLSLYRTMYHWGTIVVPPGYTDEVVSQAGGNPYGTTATVDGEGNFSDSVLPAVAHQTKRVLQVASWIKAGQG